MKTDISIPNPVYEQSEKLAQQLGISLSDFFLNALTEYLENHQDTDVTVQLNKVYETESSSLDPVLTNIQATSVREDSW